ncbi:putative FAD-binding domain, FAD/NAD(P)-binding domain-containing protein [Medicago truncatula]|uniref:Putative FAD-binding domain, FAD/NAD(P)-binding domain-containing protein n=1 Tax=Medicago truncatula TaxID=3880 RepID=A0A396K3F5_MEDTR|nr:monooxygenase 2 isoform X1 [Medicago truncatula]RHN82563.1 putative FAD-binding domain, FAD/NAD(P)-binding domain-containing protein [Medicago truncatula]
METTKIFEEEDVVIVGAGIAGLATALGLHRLGVRSLVLESSDSLRVTGFALGIWENAWKALDAVGVGDILRHKHIHLYGNVTTSLITGQQLATMSFRDKGKLELRSVRRKLLLEALGNELPNSTIRYMSKVVAIEESGFFKILHLVDGTTIKTKVLIGCDGINSVVAKWLGFKEASYTGRYGIRGFAELENNHSFEPMLMQFYGKGFRAGVVPCHEKGVYWFFTWTPATQDKELMENPAKLKQYVLNKLENMPSNVISIIEKTDLDAFHSAPLRYRHPWELIMGNISKGNVCVAGDALHPMTPDLGQGGCSALEDGVVLARCLAEALSKKQKEEEKYKRIEQGLKKYAKERRWRCIDLITTAYIAGVIQQADSKFVTFFRDKILAPLLAGQLFKKSGFDCGKLN